MYHSVVALLVVAASGPASSANTSPVGRHVVVGAGTMLYATATSKEGQPQTLRLATFEVLEQSKDRLRIRPVQGCYGRPDAAVDISVWVLATDVLSVLTGPHQHKFSDGTGYTLAAGVAVRGGRQPVAVLPGGATVPLEGTPATATSFVPAPLKRSAPTKRKAHDIRDARIGGHALNLPTMGWTSARKRGLHDIALRCFQLRAAGKKVRLPNDMMVNLLSSDTTVDAGTAVYWPAGPKIGVTRREVYSTLTQGAAARMCWRGKLGLQLCAAESAVAIRYVGGDPNAPAPAPAKMPTSATFKGACDRANVTKVTLRQTHQIRACLGASAGSTRIRYTVSGGKVVAAGFSKNRPAANRPAHCALRYMRRMRFKRTSGLCVVEWPF